MSEPDTTSLAEELEYFRAEKEKTRNLIGQIGGAKSAKKEKVITVTFVAAIIVLFTLDVMRHLLGIPIPLPLLFSLEVGILLVSIKIIWMIHKQIKVEHFQFWILNSIEFRLNDISKQIREIEERLM